MVVDVGKRVSLALDYWVDDAEGALDSESIVSRGSADWVKSVRLHRNELSLLGRIEVYRPFD